MEGILFYVIEIKSTLIINEDIIIITKENLDMQS